jgi:hypothetical protein
MRRGRICVAAAAAAMALAQVTAPRAAAPVPDYARPEAWAAYPGMPSAADAAPAGVATEPKGDVDVFFIHPTTYLALTMGNAPYDAAGLIAARFDEAVLVLQASIFNRAGRLFAPRYRQASLRAIVSNTEEGYAADEIAYGDVARAFDAFLLQNNGRRFIIAGHSQGSIHALRLLQQKVIGTRLQERLVAAYIPGVALPAEIERLGLPVCRSATQTGCVVSWNSVRAGARDQRRLGAAVIWWQGRYQPVAGRPLVCVNPLDWREGSAAPADANLGAVFRGGRGRTLPAPVPGAAGAACQDGLLRVDVAPAARSRFTDPLSRIGIYHDFDFSLFYMNVRENVAARAGR